MGVSRKCRVTLRTRYARVRSPNGLQLRHQRAELFGVQLMCDDRICKQPCSPFRARGLQNGRVFEVFLLPMAGTIRVVLTAIEVPQQLRTGQYRLARLLEDRFHWTHTRRVAALQELACKREADRQRVGMLLDVPTATPTHTSSAR